MLTFRFLRRQRMFARITQPPATDMRTRLLYALAWLLGLIVLHILAMMVFEGMGPGDALWLTMTTIVTVGYGDLSAATFWGRAATIVLLYLVGITLLAKLAGDYIDYRMQRKQAMIQGRWRWQMQDHVLIINSPDHNPVVYFQRLVRQLHATTEFANAPVQILTNDFPDGLPPALRELGVVHHQGETTDQASLQAVTPDRARAILLLAKDEYSRVSDSVTVDVLLQLQSLYGDALPRIVAELVHGVNRPRARQAGANATLRPVRGYPEMLVQSLIAPGSEQVLENLFTVDDDHTRRYAVRMENALWSDAVCRVMQAGLGTLMAYVTDDDKVVC
ncbi:MAG: ion channel, partial [Salinisphaera sp.]|nr:ion channel [Salinisphaera sp.]